MRRGRNLERAYLPLPQPHRKEQWIVPPEANGAFVAAISERLSLTINVRSEDVLDVYTQPHDPEMPLVRLDEASKQRVSEACTAIPMKPGQPERVDFEYERNGTANPRLRACAFAGTAVQA